MVNIFERRRRALTSSITTRQERYALAHNDGQVVPLLTAQVKWSL